MSVQKYTVTSARYYLGRTQFLIAGRVVPARHVYFAFLQGRTIANERTVLLAMQVHFVRTVTVWRSIRDDWSLPLARLLLAQPLDEPLAIPLHSLLPRNVLQTHSRKPKAK
jgi:hypothetical protein